MKQGKERTAKWSNEKNNAPQRTEKLPQWIHQPRKKEKEHSLKKTRPWTVLYCLLTWVPEIRQRLDSNEDVPHIQMFEQKYSEAPGGIFVLSARYKKGDCLLLHAIRRTIIVESYEVKLKSAVKIKHLSTQAQQWSLSQKENRRNPTSQRKNQGKTSQDHGMIQEKRKTTGQHKVIHPDD